MSKLRAMLLFAIVVPILSACGISVQLKPPDTSVAGVTSTPAVPVARPTTTNPSPTQAAASTSQPAGGLSVGQAAGIKPPAAPDLWTVPAGGQRVFIRPKLYSGALVTILALKDSAVQVRTDDQVEGWIHAPAAEALTGDLTPQGDRARFAPGARLRVVWPNGIPLRVGPHPDARKLREQVQSDTRGYVQQLLGDWLNVTLDDGAAGWLRWYYDGQLYVDVVSNPSTPAAQAQAPTAAFLVYPKPDGSLWRADAPGRPPIQLAAPTEPSAVLPWAAAPDGKTIAFVSGTGVWPYSYRDAPDATPALALYMVDADGSHTRKIQDLLPSRSLDLTPGSGDWFDLLPPLNQEQLAWSPDGSQLAFVSAHEGQVDLYATTRDGAITRLTRTPELELNPRWSPDGKLVACVTTHGLGTGAGWGGAGLTIVPNTGGAPKGVMQSFPLEDKQEANIIGDHRWTGADQIVLYLAHYPGGNSETRILTPSTGASTTIARFATPTDMRFIWNDSAGMLAMAPGRLGLYVWRPGDQQATLLTDAPISAFAWSPQDTTLAYSISSDDTRPDVHTGVYFWAPGSQDGPLQLTDMSAISLHWSPDGQKLAVYTGSSSDLGNSTDAGAIYSRDGHKLAMLPAADQLTLGWASQGLFFLSWSDDELGAEAKLWLWDGAQAQLLDDHLEGPMLDTARVVTVQP